MANAAHDMLSMIDTGAAQLNDKINLFWSEAKFPEVFRSATSLSHSHLQALLLALLSKCDFTDFTVFQSPADLQVCNLTILEDCT